MNLKQMGVMKESTVMVVAPLKSDESMSVMDLIMWRAGRKTFSCSENEESCEKGISLAVKISVEEELVKKAVEEE